MPSHAQASERLPKRVDHQVNLVFGEEAPPTISSSVDIKTTSLSSEDQSATGQRSRNDVTNRFDLSDLLVAIAVPPRLGQPALGVHPSVVELLEYHDKLDREKRAKRNQPRTSRNKKNKNKNKNRKEKKKKDKEQNRAADDATASVPSLSAATGVDFVPHAND
ncbi:hypothetical protein KC336_g5679 [Hortaea werneckii]|nr:hypothetical protein KC336_g5679 [Hortaea werneckii]